MSAVDDLLGQLRNVDEVVDFLASPPTHVTASVADTLSRGIAVQGLVALEEFLRARGAEWTQALNTARIAPASWPGGQNTIQERLIQNLPRNFRNLTHAQRGILVDEIGKTFSSFTPGTLVSHSVKFTWPGSNIQATDIEAIFVMAGLADKPWSELTALWRLVDPRFPGNVSAKSLFEETVMMRHYAAHDLRPPLPLANLQSITRNVRLLAVCIDSLMSACLLTIMRGQARTAVRGSGILIRKVVRDRKVWRELGPRQTRRAQARHVDLPTAMARAAQRAQPASELVLALDGHDILDWRCAV